MSVLEQLLPNLVIPIGIVVGLLILYFFLRYSHTYVYISPDEFGVVEKVFSRRGSVTNGFIALHDEAGYQPDVLRTGPHFFLPFLYRVRKQKLITVRTMAYLYARGGAELLSGQTLAITQPAANFENVRAFLAYGGQRGPQRAILREGIYAINTAQFIIFTDNGIHAIDVGTDQSTLTTIHDRIVERDGFNPIFINSEKDLLGVVTVHDGPALDVDTLIAPTVGMTAATSHNSFQDIEAFLNAAGRRGRQEQVITEGTYYINRLFATVELCPKTIIPVGMAGVVISYVGDKGVDISGADYKHGELVSAGQRGVRAEALRPGKYAINPYAMRVEQIPTTNFVLRWDSKRIEDHRYDSGLSEIPLITADAFQPKLALSVVLHISPDMAPRVIQQFASILLLVTQTLDPIISTFFKDAAQKTSLIALIKDRASLQATALTEMRTRFLAYNLDLQEVMIGTPVADKDGQIETVFNQLRERQLAEQQKDTYAIQREAAEIQKSLNEAQAIALAQTGLTNSTIQIEIAKNRGLATLAEREQDAAAIRATGLAEAAVIEAKGVASAAATSAQVKAFEGDGAEYAFRRYVADSFATAITTAKVPIVPQITSGNGTAGGNIVEAMAAMLMTRMVETPPRQNAE